MSNQKQIFAFISYSHHDVKWAKWLRKRLEWYRLPSEIHNEFEDSRFIRPIFRDRDELNAGILNEELRSRLEASKFLIVICSPNAAQSQWVSDEVKAFIEMGRLEYIIPFIVEGEPQNYDNIDIRNVFARECLPLSLRAWNKENPNKNLLGINVFDDRKKNKNKALIRVVSRMLDVQFETLWQRHKRFIRRLLLAFIGLLTLLLIIAYWFMIPVKLSVNITNEKSTLPEMEEGTLYINGTEYTITNSDTTIEIQPLPGYYRFRTIPISFKANRFYLNEHQNIKVTGGITQFTIIKLRRDNSFARFGGTVIDADGNAIKDVKVTIEGQTTLTNSNGFFLIEFPVAKQTVYKRITLEKSGYATIIRDDECPDTQLKYILRNP